MNLPCAFRLNYRAFLGSCLLAWLAREPDRLALEPYTKSDLAVWRRQPCVATGARQRQTERLQLLQQLARALALPFLPGSAMLPGDRRADGGPLRYSLLGASSPP
jgi:hypothetical protein